MGVVDGRRAGSWRSFRRSTTRVVTMRYPVAVMRRTLVIIAIGLVLAGAVVALNRPRPASHEGAKTSIGETPPTARTAAAASPKAEPPPRPSEPVRRSARRTPPPKPRPSASGDAPAPVETAHEGGILRIDSDVPGAQVFIDRAYIGVTPTTASDVKPGTHRLNVSALTPSMPTA